MMTAFSLNDLAERVEQRAAASPEVSYTRKLLDRGVAHCAKKLGEEVIAEAADLLYHFVVVLRSRDIALSEVEVALARRTATSGLDEKASRPRD
jgi:phosphoribosyl-ATP pyrophosphohydrolase